MALNNQQRLIYHETKPTKFLKYGQNIRKNSLKNWLYSIFFTFFNKNLKIFVFSHPQIGLLFKILNLVIKDSKFIRA